MKNIYESCLLKNAHQRLYEVGIGNGRRFLTRRQANARLARMFHLNKQISKQVLRELEYVGLIEIRNRGLYISCPSGVEG